jgi:ATP-dependent Clp protease ATP-binding subunit ClpX
MTEGIAHCSFCGKNKDSVGKLIVSYKVAICNECIDLCGTLLKDQKSVEKNKQNKLSIPDPMDIRNYLDQRVVGQDQAKKVLSVAVVNHFKRISNPDNEIQKSNILMIGPTGTGKTLLVKTVSKFLNVPFVVADATTLTEAGYVGDDVESLITRLYTASDNNVELCQRGIIFLDEIDKIARKSESATVSRDVSGEGVQQALLKLIEGTRCKISPPGSRKNGTGDTVEIDTTNILFIGGGAFVGLDSIVKKRIQGTGIGFGAVMPTDTDLDGESIFPDDLVKYGMIPEFVGRFGNTISLHSLTKPQLISILTEVKNNFVEQYKWLFDQDGVTLEFDTESLDLIAQRTLATKTGARGLHSELERILMCHMFDLPRYKNNNILRVMINKTQVNNPMTLAQENL